MYKLQAPILAHKLLSRIVKHQTAGGRRVDARTLNTANLYSLGNENSGCLTAPHRGADRTISTHRSGPGSLSPLGNPQRKHKRPCRVHLPGIRNDFHVSLSPACSPPVRFRANSSPCREMKTRALAFHCCLMSQQPPFTTFIVNLAPSDQYRCSAAGMVRPPTTCVQTASLRLWPNPLARPAVSLRLDNMAERRIGLALGLPAACLSVMAPNTAPPPTTRIAKRFTRIQLIQSLHATPP